MTQVDVETAVSSPSRRAGIGSVPAGWGTPLVLAVAWIALVAVSVFNRSDFWSRQTLLAITFTMAIAGVLAVGEALVAISGGILDLSIASSLIMSAYVGIELLVAGVPDALVVILMVLVGGAWGFGNAAIIVYGKLNPIIVTLATGFIGVAAMLELFLTAQPPADSGLRSFGQGYTLGLPNIFWPMVGLVLVVGLLLPRTRYGRRAIAVGGNAQAAKARGISLRRTRFAIFTAAGACSGMAAVLFVAVNASFTPDSGANYLLPVVSAVILAGITLSGGQGKLLTLFLSVGFLSTISTALVFFGLSSDWELVFSGSILIAAVSIDGYRQKQRAAT